MDLELRHLRIVCAVAEAGSVTKAAASLGLAQPAVTAQLRRIERSLGGPLFERGRHGVTPTALGDLVLTRAKVLLPAARQLHDDAVRLAAAAGRAEGDTPARIRLGTTGSPYLAEMVRLLEKSEPVTEIVTSASFRASELLDRVRSDRLDCATIGCCGEHGMPKDADLDVRKVAVEPVCVMVNENHPASALPEVPLALLADEHWAWLPGDGCLHECFVAACARAGFSPRTGYESDSATCIEMSRTGRAVTLCLPTRRAPGVVVRPIAGGPLRWVHVMVWPADMSGHAVRDLLLRRAGEAYTQIVSSAPAYGDWLSHNPTFGLAAA
jgi:DNA-binding transcriptional LysR family regulator